MKLSLVMKYLPKNAFDLSHLNNSSLKNSEKMIENIKNKSQELDELSDVRWFSLKKLHQMVETGELNNNQVAFFIKCVEFLKN